MMMGPEPMIRMRWRSLRRGIYFASRISFDEIVEQVVRIVRAGRGFGVVLHAEDRVVAVAEAFERLVVQVHVGDVDFVQVERIRDRRRSRDCAR